MSLKDIVRLLPLDRLDRETLQALVKRIDVHDSGKVTITITLPYDLILSSHLDQVVTTHEESVILMVRK